MDHNYNGSLSKHLITYVVWAVINLILFFFPSTAVPISRWKTFLNVFKNAQNQMAKVIQMMNLPQSPDEVRGRLRGTESDRTTRNIGEP